MEGNVGGVAGFGVGVVVAAGITFLGGTLAAGQWTAAQLILKHGNEVQKALLRVPAKITGALLYPSAIMTGLQTLGAAGFAIFGCTAIGASVGGGGSGGGRAYQRARY